MTTCMKARTGRKLQRYNQGCRQVAGCVPYRYKNGINDEEGFEVLLITSQNSDKKKMLLPKGGWDTDEELQESAARETFEEGFEVLLITSQNSDKKKMLLPKGGWDTDEELQESAARETFEEAGVSGIIDNDLGSWMFKSRQREGFMFSMFVKEESEFWPEKDLRSRRWMTVEEAREVCQHQWMKEALDKFSLLSSSRKFVDL